MPLATRQFKSLDDKHTFELWYTLGTLKRVRDHLAAEGVVNPKTSKPFTPYAVWMSAMRWVMEHPSEAYPYYVESGSPLTQEEWEIWLITKAMRIYGLRGRFRFFSWIKRFGFQKYSEVYSKKFGLE